MTKQEFLNNFAQKEKPKDTTSAMPFLMESIKEAKRNGIEFTKEEDIFHVHRAKQKPA